MIVVFQSERYPPLKTSIVCTMIMCLEREQIEKNKKLRHAPH